MTRLVLPGIEAKEAGNSGHDVADWNPVKTFSSGTFLLSSALISPPPPTTVRSVTVRVFSTVRLFLFLSVDENLEKLRQRHQKSQDAMEYLSMTP